MFHGISTCLLVWFFPSSVFEVGIFFWLRLFLIFAYLYLTVCGWRRLRIQGCTHKEDLDINVANISDKIPVDHLNVKLEQASRIPESQQM